MGYSTAPPVVPDTNSLIYAIKQRIDVRNLVESIGISGSIIILGCVREELFGLKESNRDALAALKFSERFEQSVSEGSGDDCIYSYAVASGAIVLTNDRNLILRLKSAGLRVLSVTGGRRIHFV